MQGKGRRRLLNVTAMLVMLAMLMVWPLESQAQRRGSGGGGSGDGGHGGHGGRGGRGGGTISVPEPSTDVLLLLGLSVTSLTHYGLRLYKKRKKEP